MWHQLSSTNGYPLSDTDEIQDVIGNKPGKRLGKRLGKRRAIRAVSSCPAAPPPPAVEVCFKLKWEVMKATERSAMKCSWQHTYTGKDEKERAVQHCESKQNPASCSLCALQLGLSSNDLGE
jgi:hypothetical protein